MISSVTSHHYEFHNSDFKQHFKKRSSDQNVEEIERRARNACKNKKIKTTSVNSSMPQQTNEISFSLRMGTSYSSLSKNTINLRDVENDVETNSSSDIPRIIDLSTGESLESVSDQLQKSRKPKRPIELVENQGELLSIGTSSKNNDDVIGENPFHSHKRIRVSKEYNFIEEEGEIDTIVHGPVVNVMKGLKTGSSNETNSVNSTKSQFSQSSSLYGKNSPNIKFTVPYQKAMSRYMRSQFQHLNNEEFGNEGKQVILYCPKKKDYFRGSFVKNNDDAEDGNYSYGKISEILEEVNVGHNGTINYINDSYEDQMDLD